MKIPRQFNTSKSRKDQSGDKLNKHKGKYTYAYHLLGMNDIRAMEDFYKDVSIELFRRTLKMLSPSVRKRMTSSYPLYLKKRKYANF